MTAISERALTVLQQAGRAAAVGRRYRLLEVTIDGQAIPDFRVSLSPRVTEVGVDSVLGLDFLGRYADIHFNVPTTRLTLSNPLSHG